jgi:hypothetical protein
LEDRISLGKVVSRHSFHPGSLHRRCVFDAAAARHKAIFTPDRASDHTIG